MTNPTVELQAKMYVFDLGNCAKEFWFKEDEDWDLCLASGEQKLELEKRYLPTISKVRAVRRDVVRTRIFNCF